MSSERQLEKKSRRTVLKLIASAASVAALTTLEKPITTTFAAPLTQVEDRTPWNIIPPRADLWYPLIPGRYPTLDQNTTRYFDQQYGTDTTSAYRTWADDKIARNPASPGVMASYGLCHASAIMALRLGEMQALELINENQAREILNNEVSFGLMVGKHMDDIQQRKNLFNRGESIAYAIDRLRSHQVIPAVVCVNNGLEGLWYYVAHGYRGSQILASGFGETVRPIDPNNITDAFYPLLRAKATSSVDASTRLDTQHLSLWKTEYTNQRVDQLFGMEV